MEIKTLDISITKPWRKIKGILYRALRMNKGGWIEGEEHIGNLLSRYYSSLFSIANPTELDPVLNGVESRIWDAMNAELIKPFMATKVQCALKQMDSDSTRGPWEIIVYSWNTINVYSLLSREWWAPLIKFMMGPTIHVRGGSTHLWYSGST